MSEIVIEEKAQTKANVLFNNIQKLKRQKKVASEALKEAFQSNGGYQSADEELSAAKQKLKQIKEALLSQNAEKQKLADEIKALSAEIKNDREILTDFYITAIKENEQLSLFDMDEGKRYSPVINLTAKKLK